MLNPIEIKFKLDKTIKRALTTELMIKSHDINVIEFHISFDGLELTADHTVKVLSVFSDTGSQTNVNCEIADGKAIYGPDTSIISQYEHVLNYVYVYHGEQSLDVRLFTYSVDSSEIDKTAIKVKTVYDQSYAELLTEFEARLQDYKDSLPQASDLRAEVDVILNKFKTDSDAKLSQYDADAQQVIADNQTAFDLAESVRNEAEESRVQAEGQRESAELSRISAESSRASAESERFQAEVERKANEESRELAEDERVSAEEQRKIDHANRSAELAGKANKKQEDWITPTLLDGWNTRETIKYMRDELGFVNITGEIYKGESSTKNVPFKVVGKYVPKVREFSLTTANGKSAALTKRVVIFTNGNIDIGGAVAGEYYVLNIRYEGVDV